VVLMNLQALTTVRFLPAACLSLLAALNTGAQEPPALVRVDTVIRQTQTETVPVIGRLVARRDGEVAAQVDGAIRTMDVQIGDRLRRGDEIAVIDNEIFIAKRNLARARLAEARARVNTVRAQLALSRQERERLAALKNTRSTSKAQYDDAVQAQAIVQAQVHEAEAAVAVANANLKLTEIDLGRTRVRAPYAGVIIQRLKETGAYVAPGDALVRLLTDSHMEVEADVPFERLAGLKPGTVVNLSLDDGRRYSARVRSVIPDENRLTRTRAVRFVADFGAGDQALAEGQTATLMIPAGPPRELISVHKDAINRGAGGTRVFVVEAGQAKIRPVQLGAAFGNRFEVLKGLREGEQVVVRGNERLRPNQPVRIGGDS